MLANGGRVLNVTASGATLAEARARAYAAIDLIDWPDGFCRRDIGWRVAGTVTGQAAGIALPVANRDEAFALSEIVLSAPGIFRPPSPR